jgi:hypothetical protein
MARLPFMRAVLGSSRRMIVVARISSTREALARLSAALKVVWRVEFMSCCRGRYDMLRNLDFRLRGIAYPRGLPAHQCSAVSSERQCIVTVSYCHIISADNARYRRSRTRRPHIMLATTRQTCAPIFLSTSKRHVVFEADSFTLPSTSNSWMDPRSNPHAATGCSPPPGPTPPPQRTIEPLSSILRLLNFGYNLPMSASIPSDSLPVTSPPPSPTAFHDPRAYSRPRPPRSRPRLAERTRCR